MSTRKTTRLGTYRQAQLVAAQESIEAHREVGINIDVQPVGPGAKQDVAVEWQKAGRVVPHWDWDEIAREFKKPGHWAFAIRSGERLAALVAARATNTHIMGEFMEGDPREDAALKGERFAIALDLLIRYAEACNLDEIRICQLSEELVKWYQGVAEFEPFPTEGKPAYYVLRL